MCNQGIDNQGIDDLRTSTPFGLGFPIINISYEEDSLRVVDHGMLKFLLGSNSCHVPIWNTSVKLPPVLRIDPVNLNLVVYNCTEVAASAVAARRDRGLVQTSLRCGNGSNMFVHAGVSYDATGNYSGYALKGCDAVFVPVMTTSGVANATDYEQLIADGFHLTWDPPPPLPPPARKFTRQIIF